MKKLLLIPLSFVLAAPAAVFAQDVIWESEDDALQFLENISQFLYNAFFIVAVIMITYAAFLYITAAGNPERIKTAKSTLLWAVVAIVIALLAGSIPNLIEMFLRP